MEHTALIYTMVLMSAADSNMTDEELRVIGNIVRDLPAFSNFDPDLLPRIAQVCAKILGQDDGLDTLLDLIAMRCRTACARRPMRSPTRSLLPTSTSTRKRSGCWRCCVTDSTSAGSSQPPSNARCVRTTRGPSRRQTD